MVQERKSKGSRGAGDGDDKEVVDFGQARAKKLEEKRRKTERIFFRQMLGIYCLTGDDKMRSLDIIDISEDGCAFRVPFDSDQPWPKDLEEIQIRMYFSQDTYLPMQLKIQHSRPSIEDGVKYVRYGCSVNKSFASYEAYRLFVLFMQSYAEQAHQDLGDTTLFYL